MAKWVECGSPNRCLARANPHLLSMHARDLLRTRVGRCCGVTKSRAVKPRVHVGLDGKPVLVPVPVQTHKIPKGF